MKKYDNFMSVLRELKASDRKKCPYDAVYRAGVMATFSLAFELSWKLLQEILQNNSVVEADTGSPREILKLGNRVGFLHDEQDWLDMQRDRNVSVHVYNSDTIDEIIERVYDRYIAAYDRFAADMAKKIKDLEDDNTESPKQVRDD